MKPPGFLKLRRKYEIDESHWLVVYARRQLRNLRLFSEWKGFPSSQEISFVARMNELEAQGFPFRKVIGITAPKVMGEGPGQVMLRWVGRKANQKPIAFVKALRKEFGRSSAQVLAKMERMVDVDYLEEAQKPYVPANEYLVEAMTRSGLLDPKAPNELTEPPTDRA
jgi:hypothetical protein